MQYYTQYANEICKDLMAFMETSYKSAERHKMFTLDKIRSLISHNWENFHLDFLSEDQIDFDSNKDCIFGGLNLPQQVIEISKISVGKPVSDQEAIKEVKDKWCFMLTSPLDNTAVPVCLMVPRKQFDNKVNNQNFLIRNVRIHYTNPSDMTLKNFLENQTLRDKLFSLVDGLSQAFQQVKGYISEPDFAEAVKKSMMDYADGDKRSTFITLVEKTRQSLYNILMDDNAHSSQPIPNLESILKQDKSKIYTMAEQKKLISDSATLIKYQTVRDWIEHPDKVAPQTFPKDEEIIRTFQEITNSLRGKEQKIVSMLIPGQLPDTQIQKLITLIALAESCKMGQALDIKNVHSGDNQSLIDLAIAHEQTNVVGMANNIVEQLTPDRDSSGKKIKRNEKLDYLQGQQIIDATQRQELGESIHHRNNLCHGHANPTDIQELADPNNQKKLTENTVMLLNKLIETKTNSQS